MKRRIESTTSTSLLKVPVVVAVLVVIIVGLTASQVASVFKKGCV
jgi:hypothetical protein